MSTPIKRKASSFFSPTEKHICTNYGGTFQLFAGVKLYRGNSSSANPLKTSSTQFECSEQKLEACVEKRSSGCFLALSADVAKTYGKHIHVFTAKECLRIIDMSTTEGYHLLRTLIKGNTSMSSSETAVLLDMFDKAYVLLPDASLTRLSTYENDGPLFRGIQRLFSEGVFGEFQGIGNSKKMRTFHPEVYVFSVDWVESKEVFTNTDFSTLLSVLARSEKECRDDIRKKGRKRIMDDFSTDEDDSNDGNDDASFKRKLF
jgi:hypothetical protein